MHKLSLTAFAAAVLALSACAQADRPASTAIMPAGALGSNGDPDIRSLNVAAYDFGRVIRNDPARVADAMAALDYMGGGANTAPRWIGMDSLTRTQMLQARQTVRSDIGINQAAPSQAVVDTMLSLAQAYRAGNQSQVQQLLARPIFIEAPATVEAHLNYLPLMPAINNVTTRAANLMSGFTVPGG